MKFTVFASLLTAASALKASSSAGKSLLSKSRALEDQNQDQEQDYSWIVNYSLQFASCHTVEQYSFSEEDNSNGQSTLVKFKLCPSDKCGYGCKGAEYLAPMADFVNAYTEWQMNDIEYKCEQIRENCVCSDDGDDEACESSCYAANGMTDSCVEAENDVSCITLLCFNFKGMKAVLAIISKCSCISFQHRVTMHSTFRNTLSVLRSRPEMSTTNTLSDQSAPLTGRESTLLSSLMNTVLRNTTTVSSPRLTESPSRILLQTLLQKIASPVIVRMQIITDTTKMLKSPKSVMSNTLCLQSASPNSVLPFRTLIPVHAITLTKSICMKLDTILLENLLWD